MLIKRFVSCDQYCWCLGFNFAVEWSANFSTINYLIIRYKLILGTWSPTVILHIAHICSASSLRFRAENFLSMSFHPHFTRGALFSLNLRSGNDVITSITQNIIRHIVNNLNVLGYDYYAGIVTNVDNILDSWTNYRRH